MVTGTTMLKGCRTIMSWYRAASTQSSASSATAIWLQKHPLIRRVGLGWVGRIRNSNTVWLGCLLTHYLLIIGLILTKSNTESNRSSSARTTPSAPTYLAYLEAAGPAAFCIPFHINVRLVEFHLWAPSASVSTASSSDLGASPLLHVGSKTPQR